MLPCVDTSEQPSEHRRPVGRIWLKIFHLSNACTRTPHTHTHTHTHRKRARAANTTRGQIWLKIFHLNNAAYRSAAPPAPRPRCSPHRVPAYVPASRPRVTSPRNVPASRPRVTSLLTFCVTSLVTSLVTSCVASLVTSLGASLHPGPHRAAHRGPLSRPVTAPAVTTPGNGTCAEKARNRVSPLTESTNGSS